MENLLLGNWKEQLELAGKLLLRIQAVAEIQSANAAVGVQLDAEGLNVVCPVGAAGKIAEVKLNLVPALIKSHWHRADKRLHARGRLVVRCTEAPAHTLVVQNGYLKCEVFLQVLDDHYEEGQLDAKSLLRVRRARNEAGIHVASNYLENRRLNILVGDALDVSVLHLRIPDLQGLRPNAVQDRQESGLEGVLKHFFAAVNK